VKQHSEGNGRQLSDVAAIRQCARQDLESGAVTGSYSADRDTVPRLLDEALATELACTLRYRRHYFLADGLAAESVKPEFMTHAQQQLAHADRIAARIVQLEGEPNFDPHGLAERSRAEYVPGQSLESMIREDLIAERIAIDSYKEMIRYVGSQDPTTRWLLEDILAQEAEHAEDLRSMLQGMS